MQRVNPQNLCKRSMSDKGSTSSPGVRKGERTIH